jgi:hypothetical protein
MVVTQEAVRRGVEGPRRQDWAIVWAGVANAARRVQLCRTAGDFLILLHDPVGSSRRPF